VRLPHTSCCVTLAHNSSPARSEEFGIFLNYVRKLGFEEAPDYDFLRELFAKILKNNGDVDDQVYDWNLLNGEWLFSPSINDDDQCSRSI
jgi:hypothetical protein